MKSWIAEIEKYVDEKTIKFVVGNKNDLEEKRQVTLEEAINFSIALVIKPISWELRSDKLQLDWQPTSILFSNR